MPFAETYCKLHLSLLSEKETLKYCFRRMNLEQSKTEAGSSVMHLNSLHYTF